MTDKDDVNSQITSIKNSLGKHNFLAATYKLVELQKMLKNWQMEDDVTPLIRDVAEQNRRSHDEKDTTLIEKRLDEILVSVK